ncbi:MATE family efflux transporter, partial [Streptococcus pneumoniae]|nr:MATE family efflux transporter [Streptococcus pneumoniae]
FNYMPAFGVATATVMQVARAVGEDDWARVDNLSKQTFWLSLFLMLPLTLSIYALGTPLSHLYTSNPVAIEASVMVTLFSLLGTPMT